MRHSKNLVIQEFHTNFNTIKKYRKEYFCEFYDNDIVLWYTYLHYVF